MTTYRERREARAERLRGWAEGREKKAAAAFDTADRMADAIPFGQPILAGHHSEGRDRRYRDRIGANMDRGVEHSRKAAEMASKAANIDAAADAAIYDDDPDACAMLERRIALTCAERDRIKAYNASCRAGAPDPLLLDERQAANIASIARVAPYQLGKGGAFPGYALSNIGGRITKDRQRLARLRGS